jgi:hypothetical protein
MRALTAILLASSCFAQTDLAGSRARLLEQEGDHSAARTLLKSSAESGDPAALLEYAEFLDRHRDPEARGAYDAVLRKMSASDSARYASVARRAAILSLAAGDTAAFERQAAAYKSASGKELRVPPSAAQAAQALTVEIPGPIHSFSRMAALSPDLRPDEVVPALARNVVMSGYQASSSAEGLEPTEYLKLVMRYLSQARELEKLAGTDKVLRVEQCESTQAADVLRVLGYRMRGGCGSDVVLETVNATRAFLTIDSGFPLAELEQALRANRPFVYDYKPSVVGVLYGAEYWQTGKDKQAEFVDQTIGDPALCRLYLGLSRLDDETAGELRKAVPAQRLKAFAHVLDFYGGMFEIDNGKAVVPGGAHAAAAWREMAGKSPDEGAAFFERLLTRDDGWLASYYDALARMNPRSRDYLLDSKRMQRFYIALRGRVTSPGPARPVFRANTDMLLLTQRLRLDANGQPHIPGGVETWKAIFQNHPHAKYEGRKTRAASTWKEPDDLLEALFALTRKPVENEPLKIFMVLTDLDRYRAKPLEAATVDRLAREYRSYGAQYALFNEVPTVTDKTIIQFLDTADALGKTRDNLRKADAAGTFQALLSLWQILCRQGAIPTGEADPTLSALLAPFAPLGEHPQIFDAGRKGVETLLAAARPAAGESPQERMFELLSGNAGSAATDSHRILKQEMMQIFEAQKLISLTTVFDIANHIEAVGRGEKPNPQLLNRLAARINDISSPRASLSAIEKNTLTFGYWTEKHIEAERRINIRAAIEKSVNDKAKLAEVRGLLAPLLRDTLVGLNYVYYAPPGAQVLQTNPLFVRSHDFIGLQSAHQTWRQAEIHGTGWPANAGGRLVGSLVNLPYALAEAEQNFLIPTREQALIWGDLVPQMLISAKVPRWWNVSPAQLSWVGLHMNQGESLIAEAVIDEGVRKQLLNVLSQHASPVRVHRVARLLEHGAVPAALEEITPSELFLIGRDWLAANKDDSSVLAVEARRLAAAHPDQVSQSAISRAFGTPKPTLSNSYAPELLNLRTFPTLMGYSSRIMAESWESNNLYFAALANELHLRPAQLNVVVPQWTQQTVERIFATHLEDWPALLRSLRTVGADARAKARSAAGAQQASLN